MAVEGEPELVRIAYHEAGHAVATMLLGLDVNEVSIVPGKGRLGHQENLYEDDTRPATWTNPDGHVVNGLELIPSVYKAHIVGLYAGRAAVAMLDGEHDPGRAFTGMEGDDHDKRQAAKRITVLWGGGREHRRRARRYRRVALWLMWRHRIKIERVAEALLRFGRLEMDDVDAAVEGGAGAVERFRKLLART